MGPTLEPTSTFPTSERRPDSRSSPFCGLRMEGVMAQDRKPFGKHSYPPPATLLGRSQNPSKQGGVRRESRRSELKRGSLG